MANSEYYQPIIEEKSMGFIAETGKSTQQQEVISTTNINPTYKERKKGGLKTLPFIIGNETFEKVASYGLLANMMLYLIGEYHIRPTTGITVMFLWQALSNFTPIFGAFLSDSFLGRFRVIALASLVSLTGMILLLLTATIPQLRPPYCNRKIEENCVTAEPWQRVILFSSFALMSIGAGGIRPCSMAFGADQINNPGNPNNERVLQTFFNWYYASVGVSLMVAMTAIVFIQDQFGWKIGFGVPLGLMVMSTAMFFLGCRLYVIVKGDMSLLCGFAHVVVAAWKNIHLALPPISDDFDGWYYHRGYKLVAPTEKLRFLNRACMIKKDNDPQTNTTHQPWDICTVKQVEELKALIKVLPIWSTGIVIATVMSQHAIWFTQAQAMDRRLSPDRDFKIPAGSFSVFTILALTLWVAIYDRIVVPLISKLTNGRRPNGLTFQERIGIGLLIACAATSAAAFVEKERRREAFFEGKTMSALWLIPQYSLSGLAEGFNAIGQIEFYYSQFPRTMASVAVALLTVGMGFGNLVGVLIVKVVNEASKSGGVGWVADDINRGRYDMYYWVLTFMGLVNFLYFCLCSWGYGDCEDRDIWGDDDEGESWMRVENIASK